MKDFIYSLAYNIIEKILINDVRMTKDRETCIISNKDSFITTPYRDKTVKLFANILYPFVSIFYYLLNKKYPDKVYIVKITYKG